MIRLLHTSIKLDLEGNGFNVEAYSSVQVEFDFCFTVNLKSERFRKAFLSFYRFIQLMHG